MIRNILEAFMTFYRGSKANISLVLPLLSLLGLTVAPEALADIPGSLLCSSGNVSFDVIRSGQDIEPSPVKVRVARVSPSGAISRVVLDGWISAQDTDLVRFASGGILRADFVSGGAIVTFSPSSDGLPEFFSLCTLPEPGVVIF